MMMAVVMVVVMMIVVVVVVVLLIICNSGVDDVEFVDVINGGTGVVGIEC